MHRVEEFAYRKLLRIIGGFLLFQIWFSPVQRFSSSVFLLWRSSSLESMTRYVNLLVVVSEMSISGQSISDNERTDTIFLTALGNVLILSWLLELAFISLSASVLTTCATGLRNLLLFSGPLVSFTRYLTTKRYGRLFGEIRSQNQWIQISWTFSCCLWLSSLQPCGYGHTVWFFHERGSSSRSNMLHKVGDGRNTVFYTRAPYGYVLFFLATCLPETGRFSDPT